MVTLFAKALGIISGGRKELFSFGSEANFYEGTTKAPTHCQFTTRISFENSGQHYALIEALGAAFKQETPQIQHTDMDNREKFVRGEKMVFAGKNKRTGEVVTVDVGIFESNPVHTAIEIKSSFPHTEKREIAFLSAIRRFKRETGAQGRTLFQLRHMETKSMAETRDFMKERTRRRLTVG